MSPDAAIAGPATKVQSAGLESGYPHGHLGHLTHDEETAFKGFKAYLAERGLYRPGPPPSHDDPTLLRFLRARRWVIPDAYKQFKETEEWRAAIQIDTLYDTIDADAYDHSRRLYPQWIGRRDKRGIPVYLFEICHLDSKTISEYEKSVGNTYSKAAHDGKTPARLIRLFALYENLTRFAQPLCTQLTDREHARTPITLSTNIVDVGGTGLKQFWNLKAHMQAASQLATAHYPETLDRIFIIGAPLFFSTVWGWVKRWFDPVTVSKIFILSPHEVLPVLSSFIDVKNIPKKYGGELDFSWGDKPNLDPKIRETCSWVNGYTEFPKGPVYWRPIDDGKRWECVAVGSVGQKERMERVCTIPVAFADEKMEEAAAAAATVTATVAANGEKLEEAPADIPSANGSAVKPAGEVLAPAVTDGTKEVTVPATTTAANRKQKEDGFQDVPEKSLESPLVSATQGIQNLTLHEADKKANGGDAAVSEKAGRSEAIPNGKAVAVS